MVVGAPVVVVPPVFGEVRGTEFNIMLLKRNRPTLGRVIFDSVFMTSNCKLRQRYTSYHAKEATGNLPVVVVVGASVVVVVSAAM